VRRRKPIIGITMGEPAGIGPEVVVKSIIRPEVRRVCVPVVFGSPKIIRHAVRRFAKKFRVEEIIDFKGIDNQRNLIWAFPCSDLDYKSIKPGKVTKISGHAAAHSVFAAANVALSGDIDAIVTAPLTKKGLILAGYDFKGHTDFLAFISGTKKYAMIFVGQKLNVVLVTTHIPLSEVSKTVTFNKVREKIELADQMLKKIFSIRKPKIGVCGLNPHAGEEGILGQEEKRVILPAVRSAVKKGIKAYGPLPSDSIFSPVVVSKFDCIVAMYHDQGIIPFKLSGIGNAVNLTWGLPFIRTSPDHGTAFDIAWKGKADPKGMINAILLAAKLSRKRL
jgi:4-hydroxythreonine-4-phosphate dehydrogenase